MTAPSAGIQLPERSGRCRRAYFRVRTRLPVRIIPLTPSAAEDFARTIPTVREDAPDGADARLSAQMRRIETKLDLLLAHFGHEICSPLGADDARNVLVSGAGLCLETEGSFRDGDPVGIELMLPEGTPRLVRALGAVVSQAEGRPPFPGRSLALAFRVINEDDRDAIIRHAYEVQRFHLRTRSEADRRS